MDSRLRSFAKAVCWRTGSLFITSGVAWAVTHEWRFAATIGLLDLVIKLGLFYLHERAWERVSFGRTMKADYEI